MVQQPPFEKVRVEGWFGTDPGRAVRSSADPSSVGGREEQMRGDLEQNRSVRSCWI